MREVLEAKFYDTVIGNINGELNAIELSVLLQRFYYFAKILDRCNIAARLYSRKKERLNVVDDPHHLLKTKKAHTFRGTGAQSIP